MAKFPDNPKIGQAFLSDPASLYVWSGYQWILSSGRYGYFHDEITQTAVVNTATPVRLRSTDLSRSVSVESDSSGNLTQVHFSDIGKYNVAFSLQLDRASSTGTVAVVIWMRKNEIDIPWSASQLTLSGGVGLAKNVPSRNFIVDITDPSDYIQLMWRTPDAGIQIISLAANSAQPNVAAYPGTPSAILSVNQIGY